MTEESIETQELKERLEEAREFGEASEARVAWLTWLSLSTAIVAVVAAIAALESGTYANDALVAKNDAILHQAKAADAWGYFQAKGVEATVYETQADAVDAREADRAANLVAKLRAAAAHERSARASLRDNAEEEERAVERANEKSDHSLHVHHTFAKSVTIFQVAIALSAIAALTRRKPMWWVSLAVGVVGASFFMLGFARG